MQECMYLYVVINSHYRSPSNILIIIHHEFVATFESTISLYMYLSVFFEIGGNLFNTRYEGITCPLHAQQSSLREQITFTKCIHIIHGDVRTSQLTEEFFATCTLHIRVVAPDTRQLRMSSGELCNTIGYNYVCNYVITEGQCTCNY